MNNQIFITAALITAGALVALLLIQLSFKLNWKYYWIPFLVMLPGSFFINYAVKDWLLLALNLWTPQSNYSLFLVYFVVWVLIVGVTEELIKILPIAAPKLRNHMTETAVGKFTISWSLGTGFGLGEVWYLACILSIGSTIDGYAWYQLTGFLFERVLVIFLHGAFTVVALYGFNKKKLWLSIIVAILAHGIIDYIAIATSYVPGVYFVFIILAIMGQAVMVLAYLDARSKDKKREWEDSLQKEDGTDKNQNDIEEELEVISLFPSVDEKGE